MDTQNQNERGGQANAPQNKGEAQNTSPQGGQPGQDPGQPDWHEGQPGRDLREGQEYREGQQSREEGQEYREGQEQPDPRRNDPTRQNPEDPEKNDPTRREPSINEPMGEGTEGGEDESSSPDDSRRGEQGHP